MSNSEPLKGKMNDKNAVKVLEKKYTSAMCITSYEERYKEGFEIGFLAGFQEASDPFASAAEWFKQRLLTLSTNLKDHEAIEAVAKINELFNTAFHDVVEKEPKR